MSLRLTRNDFFKEGDYVRIRKNSQYYGISPTHNPADKDGVVYLVDAYAIYVKWSQGENNSYSERDLELSEIEANDE